jgi:hypothetical protein
MDAERFERVLRVLTTSTSRRQTSVGVVGLVLGGVIGRSLPAVTAKGKKGKGKRGKKAKKRQCVPNCAGKLCGDDGCGNSCGSCGALTCSGGTCGCLGVPDFTDCGGEKQCSGGVCAAPPTCRTGCGCSSPPGCCSGTCVDFSDCCAPSSGGGSCRTAADCASGFSSCVGFVCQR